LPSDEGAGKVSDKISKPQPIAGIANDRTGEA